MALVSGKASHGPRLSSYGNNLRMRLPLREPLGLTAAISGLLFIGINVADAWLTTELLVRGGAEANWWRMLFDASVFSATNFMVIKALLATAVVLVLIRLGKGRLLWLLNVGISIVVLLNLACFMSYLAGLYGWFQ